MLSKLATVAAMKSAPATRAVAPMAVCFVRNWPGLGALGSCRATTRIWPGLLSHAARDPDKRLLQRRPSGGSGTQHVWFVVIACGRRRDSASPGRDRHGERSCVKMSPDAGAYRPGTPAAGVRRERRPAFMLGGAGHHAGRAVVLRCVCMVFVTGSDPSCPCPWGEGASGRSLPRRAGRCRDHGGEDPARDFRADPYARRRAVSSCARPRTTGPWGWPLPGPMRAATAVRAPLPARPAPSRRRTAVPRPGCGG